MWATRRKKRRNEKKKEKKKESGKGIEMLEEEIKLKLNHRPQISRSKLKK